VSFIDTDGDMVTLRKVGRKVCPDPSQPPPIETGRRTALSCDAPQVDFYVGGKLKLEGAIMVQNGNALQFTGKETKGTPLSMFGFNLEDTITMGATPADIANVDKAMALVN
jgi:hypothetical protein